MKKKKNFLDFKARGGFKCASLSIPCVDVVCVRRWL